MELKELTYKMKCDMPGCRNLAKYLVESKGVILRDKLCFCENCLEEIYFTYSKKITPKSPINMLNKKKSKVIK